MSHCPPNPTLPQLHPGPTIEREFVPSLTDQPRSRPPSGTMLPKRGLAATFVIECSPHSSNDRALGMSGSPWNPDILGIRRHRRVFLPANRRHSTANRCGRDLSMREAYAKTARLMVKGALINTRGFSKKRYGQHPARHRTLAASILKANQGVRAFTCPAETRQSKRRRGLGDAARRARGVLQDLGHARLVRPRSRQAVGIE